MEHDDPKNGANAPDDSIETGDDKISRRDVVKRAWVAPVFVAVNLPKGAFAAGAVSPVATPVPTSAPTPGAPTAAPTTVPTAAPTTVPTAAPTVAAPTVAAPTAPSPI